MWHAATAWALPWQNKIVHTTRNAENPHPDAKNRVGNAATRFLCRLIYKLPAKALKTRLRYLCSTQASPWHFWARRDGRLEESRGMRLQMFDMTSIHASTCLKFWACSLVCLRIAGNIKLMCCLDSLKGTLSRGIVQRLQLALIPDGTIPTELK